MSMKLAFVLFALALACRPPARVLIVKTTRHCHYCAKQLETRRDSFSVEMSVYDVNELGLRDFAGPSSQTAQAFTTGRILDSLKRGRRLFAVDTYDDTCDSCMATPVSFQTGLVYVCEQCGKTYSKAITVHKIPRRTFKGDSIRTVKGVCGARACKLRSRHPGWSLDDCQTIVEGKIRIGFTQDQAIAAWGRPDDINRTVGSWGTHEQWCYGMSTYLYFEDGVLTSFQD